MEERTWSFGRCRRFVGPTEVNNGGEIPVMTSKKTLGCCNEIMPWSCLLERDGRRRWKTVVEDLDLTGGLSEPLLIDVGIVDVR